MLTNKYKNISSTFLREALKKNNHGDSEYGPTPLNPPSPTSDREKNVGIVVSKFRPPHPLRR